MRKKICILAFSPIARDARVLRQIKYLLPHYDMVVIGYGAPPPEYASHPNVQWITLPDPKSSLFTKVKSLLFLSFGKILPLFFEIWYWAKREYRMALKYATANPCDFYHANDWEMLPVGAKASQRNSAKLIFDAHEFAPLEQDAFSFRFFKAPAIHHFLKRYTPQVNSTITVVDAIAAKLLDIYGLSAQVVMNIPENQPVEPGLTKLDQVRLIHHGVANRDRRLEQMIKVTALCDARYSLYFMLLGKNDHYLEQLKEIAQELAPGRVHFCEPVDPYAVVEEISQYDIGLYVLDPGKSYNNMIALPNKFFDFITAGLAVCIGPSPSMAEFVVRYRNGVVSKSFTPEEIAGLLNALTADEINAMRKASWEAAQVLNAENEMKKLTAIYEHL